MEGVDDDLLNTPQAGGKWSIAQHIAHSLLVAKKAMQYVQHKLAQQDNLRPVALSHPIRSLLLKLALHSGKRY
ncbi:DinB family protein [Pontibacter russatus]|uniref:DinB family protein n=1 Tax=Pontibacter russatus TaxID=2694929 RepID=UPI001F36DB92|nr:DinB family protein [Pontibacter russatus]